MDYVELIGCVCPRADLLAYALLGTSRQLVVGPDTATGLISAVTVGVVVIQGTAEFNELTSTLAVLIGIFFLSFTKLWNVLQHLPEVSFAPALTGILCLTAMQLLRYLAPGVPAALVVMAAATILIGLLGGEAAGVHVAGHIPSGLPHLAAPGLDATTFYELAPGALAIVLVGYAEALG